MSVAQGRSVETVGTYVPYHMQDRGGSYGLVGTLQVDAEATGDASGGTMTINLNMKRDEFGFPVLWVPTVAAVFDNLASPEVVSVVYQSTGNRRLSTEIRQTVVSLSSSPGNAGVVQNVTIPIEGEDETVRLIMQAIWASNVDTKSYHLHVFGPVYDLQYIARVGGIADLAAGIR